MQLIVFGNGPVRGGKLLELQRRDPLMDQCKLAAPKSGTVLTDGFFQRILASGSNLKNGLMPMPKSKKQVNSLTVKKARVSAL